MNTESTIDTSAVVTPNCAMDNRSQTISYRRLQNPETKKNPKNQRIDFACVMRSPECGESTSVCNRGADLATIKSLASCRRLKDTSINLRAMPRTRVKATRSADWQFWYNFSHPSGEGLIQTLHWLKGGCLSLTLRLWLSPTFNNRKGTPCRPALH